MSVPNSNSCGSCAAATTRTPWANSSVDGCVFGSVPVGRRLRTTTSWPASASAVARWYTCRPRPPITTGGYSHDTIRTLMGGRSPAEAPGIECAEQSVGTIPSVGQSLRMLAAAGRQPIGDLAGGVCVEVGAVARIIGRRVLADHERPVAGHRQQRLAQDLVGDEIPWGGCAHRRGLFECLVHSGQCGVDDFVVELDQIGNSGTRPHLPVLARTPGAGRQVDR